MRFLHCATTPAKLEPLNTTGYKELIKDYSEVLDLLSLKREKRKHTPSKNRGAKTITNLQRWVGR